MNIRKNVDYSEMYKTLDHLMAQELSQMALYWGLARPCAREPKRVQQLWHRSI